MYQGCIFSVINKTPVVFFYFKGLDGVFNNIRNKMTKKLSLKAVKKMDDQNMKSNLHINNKSRFSEKEAQT